MHRIILLASGILSTGALNGCGTVVGWADPPELQLRSITDADDKIYLGTRLDAEFLGWAGSHGPGGFSGMAWVLTTGTVGVLDLLASAVADTLLLPYLLIAPGE